MNGPRASLREWAARRDAKVLRDFARMCTAMESIASPATASTFGIAAGMTSEIADKLEQHGVTMAQQADGIEREAEGRSRPLEHCAQPVHSLSMSAPERCAFEADHEGNCAP